MSKADASKASGTESSSWPIMGRRGFLGTVGAAGISMAIPSSILLAPEEVMARSLDDALVSQAEQIQLLLTSLGDTPVCTGILPPGACQAAVFPTYDGPWTKVAPVAYGGFDFVLSYMSEGVAGVDPLSKDNPHGPFSNTSGLFEQFSLQAQFKPGDKLPIAADTGTRLNPVPSAVGGNERPARSVETWLRDIELQSNQTIANDLWSAINWARRVWGIDYDDPAADGIVIGGVTYQYPGSPDPKNEASLLAPRAAVVFDSKGEVTGFARSAPTFLAPDNAYTVMLRSGHSHPTYTGGIVVNGIVTHTTAPSETTPGKVRDGGFWGGVLQGMDVLADLQALRRGKRMFTTPTDPARPLSGTTPPSPSKRGRFGGTTTKTPRGNGAQWGQWWRRVAPIVGLDVDDPSLLALSPSPDATRDIATAANPGNIPFTNVPARPAARPKWPIGFLPAFTFIFYGGYNLKFGEKEIIKLHYQSEVPTAFPPPDGVPGSFICDLCPNPGSVEIKGRADMSTDGGIGLFDPSGEVSGFPDVSDPALDGQTPPNQPGNQMGKAYGRVHGVGYPRETRRDALTTFKHRNTLLWPPTLNDTNLGNPRQDFFGNINWTIPTKGDQAAPKNPFPILPLV